MELVLISCSSKKLDRMAAARDLYISPLFRASVKWAEVWGCEWAVMSAKYGLVKPHTHIHPYDFTITNKMMGYSVARMVLGALATDKEYEEVTELIVLAGRRYVDPLHWYNQWGDTLSPSIKRSISFDSDSYMRFRRNNGPYVIAEPLQGMQTGQRLSWLKGPGLECWDTYQG